MHHRSRAGRLNGLLRSKAKVVNGFELRILGLTMVAVAPLLSPPVTIAIVVSGVVLFVVGLLQKRTIKELPIPQALILLFASMALTLTMLLQ